MDVRKYQDFAMRTNDGKSTERLLSFIENHPDIDVGGVFNGIAGLNGESGEFSDIVKKWVFHEKEVGIEHLKKEMGDIMWYIALICTSFGWNLDEIMQLNVDKLLARYPDGFDTVRANNRSKDDI